MARFTLADIRKISALLICTLILFTANGLQATLAPVRAEAGGFSTMAVGWIGTAFFIGFVAGCLIVPKLLQTLGHVRTFALLTAAGATALLLHPMDVNIYAWTILRAVMGFAAAGMYAIVEGWLNHQANNAIRGRVFTTYATLNAVALIAGNALFAQGDPNSSTMFMWVAVLTIACLVPIAVTRQPEPPKPTQVRLRVWRLFGLAPAGFAGAACSGLAGGAFWALAMNFAQSRGFDQSGVAWFMSAVIFGGALAQWPMGKLSDFMDRRVVIMLAAFGATLASLALAFAPVFGSSAVAVTFGAAMAFGASSFPIGSLANAHINDRSHAGDVSETATSILLISGSAAGIGTILGAQAMTAAGSAGLFYYTAIVHIALVAFVVTRIAQRPPERDGLSSS